MPDCDCRYCTDARCEANKAAPEACPKCGSGVYQRKDDGSRFYQCGTIRWSDGEFQQTAPCRLAELERIVATAERDAARYRFIRDKPDLCVIRRLDNQWSRTLAPPMSDGKELDAAIDSMMAAEPHREEA